MNQQEDGYPYDYGKFIFNKDFIAYQYYSAGIQSGSGRSIEIRDSSNNPLRLDDNRNQFLKHAFESNGRKFGLFSDSYSLRLYEFKRDTLEFKESLDVGSEYFWTIISDWNEKSSSHLISGISQKRILLYEISADGFKEFKSINSENERWSVISLDFENLYVIKTDSSTLQNSLWKINLATLQEQFISSEIASGNIGIYEANDFSVINDLSVNDYYRFSIDKEKLEKVSTEELIGGSAELGKSKVMAQREAPDLEYYLTEPYVIDEDTIMLKNIMTNGALNYLHTFKWDDDFYFSLNEKDNDLSIYKLNSESNEVTFITSFPGEDNNSSYVFPYSGKNNSGAVFRGGYGSNQFYINKTKEGVFDLNHFDRDVMHFTVNSEDDLILSGNEELLKYSLEKKEFASIWKNKRFYGSSDPNTFLTYKDWIFITSDQTLLAFNTVSEELIALSNSTAFEPKLWNNRLLGFSNDSLFLYEIDYNFEKHLLLTADYLGGFYDFQFTGSTFSLVSDTKAIVSDGTCANTRIVHEGDYQEILTLYQTTSSNTYGIYDKVGSDIILFDTNDSSKIHNENINLYSVIFTGKSIYYQTSGQDSLMKIDLESKKIQFITQLLIDPNQAYNNYLHLISQNLESLYFRIGRNLFRLDLKTDNITVKSELLDDGYINQISFGKGSYDLALINGKPLLINKTDLSFSSLNTEVKNYSNSITDLGNHWIVVLEKELTVIDKENLENRVFHLPQETNYIQNILIKKQKLFATVNDDKYGDQVWFIAQIEGLEELVADNPKGPFAKLPDNICFQPLAIEEPNEVEILVYPNPNEGRFNIQVPKELSNIEFEIYETSGLKVDFESRQQSDFIYSFTVKDSGLTSIILKVISQEENFSKKVILRRN
ncbi:hypothetical protein [Jiulongibacter sediminis]|uniref:hypothetical protein n=1 Tax=Jiulongibacter sediminis TaxID=1605367 RepID=UPI0026EFD22C|nr:hypothetical protein [Jiulongibacter sediminis]